MPNKLFDLLAGAGNGGNGINRNSLNAQVAEAQAENGYRDAETIGAFQRARQARDEAQASEQRLQAQQNLGTAYTQLLISRGMPADRAATLAQAYADVTLAGGNVEQAQSAVDATTQRQIEEDAHNPNLDPQTRTLAQNALVGILGDKRYQELGPGRGMYDAVTGQTTLTPMDQAQLANEIALKGKNAAAGTVDPGVVKMGAYMVRKYGAGGLNALGLPSFGGAAVRTAVDQEVNQQIQNGVPLQDNPDYDAIFSNSQTAQAQQHAQNTAAASTFSANALGQVQKMGSAVQHMQLALSLRHAMTTHDSPLIQKLAAGMGMQVTGDPQTWAANYLSGVLGSEVTSAYVAGGGGEMERMSKAANFGVDVPEPAFEANVNAATNLIGGAYRAWEQRAVGAVAGMEPDPQKEAQARSYARSFLLPDAQAAFSRAGVNLDPIGAPPASTGAPSAAAPSAAGPLPGSAGGAPAPSGNPPRVTQTPPGTPGGTPAAGTPGAQPSGAPVPPGGAPTASPGDFNAAMTRYLLGPHAGTLAAPSVTPGAPQQ
jgi:hypothetical protein